MFKKNKPMTAAKARKITKFGRTLGMKKRKNETIKTLNNYIEARAMEGDMNCFHIFDNHDGFLSLESMGKILNHYIDMGFNATLELESANEYVSYERYHVTIDWSENND